MAGRTLDALVIDKLGLSEMVILRLRWQIEDLQAQLAALQSPPQPPDPPKDTPV